MSNEMRIHWLTVVVGVALVSCITWLVVVNGSRSDVGRLEPSEVGLRCLNDGALYYNTSENRIVEFECVNNGGW